MKERENIPSNDQKTGEVLGKYETLLDHYKIGAKTREGVWPEIIKSLNTDPQKTTQEIEKWWEEAFAPKEKPPDNGPRNPKTSHQEGLRQLPKNERIIYESRKRKGK